MNNSLMFTAILVQILLKSLAAANTRISSLPVELGFNAKNINDSSVFSHKKTVVCMLDSWSHWRVDGGAFTISNIDPTLCTQIVYRNAAIDNTTFQVKIRDPRLAEGLGWFRKIVALSKEYPHLKVFLSVGGWNEGSYTFSKIAADYNKRTIFVDSVLRILQEYGFHGIDIAWEYPAWPNRGGTPQDKENLPLLMNDLRTSLKSEYMISLTVAGNTHFARPAYNLQALAKLVNQFNVRTFDFSGAWDGFAYHHSPLSDSESRQSVVSSVNYYLANGAPADKLVVGIPLHGRTFLLKDDMKSSSENETVLKMSGLEQPTNGRFGGSWVPDDLMMGYHEICHEISNLNKDNWQTYWDNFCTVPFARHNKRWVTFDNPESIENKATFVVSNKLKGVMAWTIDTDDFQGTACKWVGDGDDEVAVKVTYPLLRTINLALYREETGKARSETQDDTKNTFNNDSQQNKDSDLQKSVPSVRSSGENMKLTAPSFLAVIVTWLYVPQ